MVLPDEVPLKVTVLVPDVNVPSDEFQLPDTRASAVGANTFEVQTNKSEATFSIVPETIEYEMSESVRAP